MGGSFLRNTRPMLSQKLMKNAVAVPKSFAINGGRLKNITPRSVIHTLTTNPIIAAIRNVIKSRLVALRPKTNLDVRLKLTTAASKKLITAAGAICISALTSNAKHTKSVIAAKPPVKKYRVSFLSSLCIKH